MTHLFSVGSLVKSALLLSLVASATVLDRADAECQTIHVRREIRDLLPHEFAQFAEAIKTLMNGPRPNVYDKYVEYHMKYQKEAHGTPIFLPWHRKYLKELENELQHVSPGTILPYWDWSADAQAPELSDVLSGNYFGGDGQGPSQCITNGVFKDFKPYHRADGTPECIARKFDQNGRIGAFANPEELLDIITNSHGYDDFRAKLEGYPHGRVHNGLGSSFSTMASPNDPLFYMHHAHVDKIWYDWQQAHPNLANDFGASDR
ncbi:hypothetical protein THASP1DRAFT_18173, partial [Thamnocephalis sphaerospora]